MLSLLLAFTIFYSCNPAEEKKDSGVQPAMPAAEKKLRDAMAQYPDSLLLRENLIQYFRDNSNYEMALAETDVYLKKDSNNPRFWDIRANLSIENEDTLQAIRSFEKAIELYPDPGYIMSLGAIYAQTKNPMALAMADALMQATKAKAGKEALFIKGLYYNYTGDKTKAISFFDQCLALDYTYMFAYREKGIALYETGQYQKAVDVLTRAVTLQNNYDEGYYWLGRSFEKLNRKADAIEAYKTALLYSPDYMEAQDALSKLK